MRRILCYSAVALLGLSTAAPFHPPSAAREGAACNQSEVGEVKKRDSRGLTLKVITACKQEPRISFLGIRFGVKCTPVRKEVHFDQTADGSRYYTANPVANGKCCEGTAQLPIRGRQQVQQRCRP